MDGIVDTISVGKGLAYLVNWEYSDIYAKILSDLDIEDDDWDDFVFIEGLTNGGVKGDGLLTLQQAVARGKEFGRVLVFILSGANQVALRQWYLSTELFEQTRLLNVLINNNKRW